MFYAGSLIGDQGKSMFKFGAPLPFENRVEFQIQNVEMVDKDVRVDAVNKNSLEQIIGNGL